MEDKFIIDDRVTMVDHGETVYGFVVGFRDDIVLIEWDDICDPCQHTKEEWWEITVIEEDN